MKNAWKIVNKKSESKWIEEEEFLLNWAENPTFEKQPLSNIQVTFVYIGDDQNIVGVTQTTMELKKCERSSILNRSTFFEQIDHAKKPKTIFIDDDECDSFEWLNKTYTFYDAAIYSIPNDPDNIDKYDMKTAFDPLHFLKDTIKINSALDIFHDLYEIVVIMKQETVSYTLKSILKDGTKINRTKKVQISENLPKRRHCAPLANYVPLANYAPLANYVPLVKGAPVYRKRKTQKRTS